MVLKRIDPFSCGQVLGVLYAAFGLVFGGFFSLVAVLGAAAQQDGGPGAAGGIIMGVAAVVIMPVMYGVMGFLGGLIGAFLYNLAAGFIGGVRVEFEQFDQIQQSEPFS
ncbi:MAG: hypothetical protein AAGA92_09570 [Planctomycetota bacterium]